MKLSELKQVFNKKQKESPIKFIEESPIKIAKKLIEKGENIFITGGGGVGKSYLLKQLVNEYNITVTSTTGISALNVGGQTVHSWSGIGLANKSLSATIDKIIKNKFKLKQIQATEILAIDEISMLDNYTLDFLNSVLKEVNGNRKVFGGIQVILIGDFFQLPPVQLGENRDFCFKSKTWQELNLKTLNLTKVWRQSDKQLINSLNDIRRGIKTNTQIFESRIINPPKDCVRLYATNQEVNNYNKQCFDAINKKVHTYESYDIIKSYVKGSIKDLNPYSKEVPEWDKLLFEQFNQNCRIPKTLLLKETCRVMLLQNLNVKQGLVNGSCGEVVNLSSHSVTVRFDNGIERVIEATDFEYFQQGKVKIRRSQIPLTLAYACSIHKSQGMTFDKIFVDFKRIFTFGQAYVALSRVKTLDGLFLNNFDANKIQANPEVIEFYQSFN